MPAQPESEATMFQKILVGYDGSKGGKAALERAAVAAKHYNAQLTALWVRQPLPQHADLPGETEGEAEAAADYFEERKREVAELAKQQGIEIACESRAGHAAKVIVNFAKEGGYDLVVIGHSDHSELWGRLLGRYRRPHQRPRALQRADRQILMPPLGMDDLALQFDSTDAGKRFIEGWKRARIIVDTGGGHSKPWWIRGGRQTAASRSSPARRFRSCGWN